MMKLAAILLVGLAGCQAKPQESGGEGAAARATAASPTVAVQTSAVSGLPLLPLEIRTGRKVHKFTVEVARTGSEQAYGLMNRTSLGDQEGMLFPFATPRAASFWMKNTLIPLDMIFVRADGSIARIAARTTPNSLDPVAVGEPVVAVLELRGGRAAELGIGETARVSWPSGPN
jgi:hypothetical protein